MKPLQDFHGDTRRARLRGRQVVAPQREQSDFEKSFAFRLAFVTAIVVIGINLFSSPPPPTPSAPSSRATV
jgi:hypothetical protein